jgi:putative restriction endonuclease
MPRLSKRQMLDEVENSIRASGWNLLYLSARGDHPARYTNYRGDVSHAVRVYIWNISHGGGPRSAAEYRIQITGLDPNQFMPEIGGKTLILGWWPNDEVFAGFDYRRHGGPLGGSPSMQIGLPALQAAVAHRFAPHRKNNGEVAIAFRPDFMGTYIDNLEALHDTGAVPQEVDLLERIAADPEDVDDDEVATTVAGPRQYAVVQTRRALRALDFSERVLGAYGSRCAMCGMQLRLVDGAHILPVAAPGSTDETSNGVALCALHHRAYDRGLVTFDTDYEIWVNEDRLAEFREADVHRYPKSFTRDLREVIRLPPDKGNRPNPAYIERANALRRWDL